MNNVFKQFSQQVLSEQKYGNDMNSEDKAKFELISDNKLSALFYFDEALGLLKFSHVSFVFLCGHLDIKAITMKEEF